MSTGILSYSTSICLTYAAYSASCLWCSAALVISCCLIRSSAIAAFGDSFSTCEYRHYAPRYFGL